MSPSAPLRPPPAQASNNMPGTSVDLYVAGPLDQDPGVAFVKASESIPPTYSSPPYTGLSSPPASANQGLGPPPNGDIRHAALENLYNLLWKTGTSVCTIPQEQITVPKVISLPAFYDFGDKADPPEGLVDFSNCHTSSFDFMRLPSEVASFFPGSVQDLKKVLIRPCYRQLLEEIGSDGDAVVLGQRGVGKSTFLIFVLFERLLRGDPTALQLLPEEIWTFTENGVFCHKPKDVMYLGRNHYPEGCWFLTDFSPRLPGLSSSAIRAPRRGKVVFTSTPGSHYERWTRMVNGMELWMNPCSLDELYAIGGSLGVVSNPHKAAKLAFVYEKYGPGTPIHFAFSPSQAAIHQHEEAIRTALPHASEPCPGRHSLYLHLGSPEDHAVLAIRTVNLWSISLLPASTYVLRLLSDRILPSGADSLGEFYQSMLQSAGDAIDIRCFLEIVVVYMLSLQGGSFRARSLSGRRIDEFVEMRVLPGGELVHFSNNQELSKLMSRREIRGRVWVPRQTAYASVDAVVVNEDGLVWLIQIITESKGGIHAKALNTLAQVLPLGDEKKPWNFLFVVRKRLGEPAFQKVSGDDTGMWAGGLQQFVLGLE